MSHNYCFTCHFEDTEYLTNWKSKMKWFIWRRTNSDFRGFLFLEFCNNRRCLTRPPEDDMDLCHFRRVFADLPYQNCSFYRLWHFTTSSHQCYSNHNETLTWFRVNILVIRFSVQYHLNVGVINSLRFRSQLVFLVIFASIKYYK